MSHPRAAPRTNAEKVSSCLGYITGEGGFRSFSQFLSALLDNDHRADQVVAQTVSHFLNEDHLRPFFDKIATHRRMRHRDNMQSLVPHYGFRPGDHQEEGVSTASEHVFMVSQIIV